MILLLLMRPSWFETAASTSILGQPLNTPAQLDLAVFTIAETTPSQIPLSGCVDFGSARLTPGNTPRPWTLTWAQSQPDRHLLNPADQQQLANQWLTWLGLDNGYDNIE